MDIKKVRNELDMLQHLANDVEDNKLRSSTQRTIKKLRKLLKTKATVKKAEEILVKHCLSMSDEFLTTDKDKRFKQSVLDAMEEFKLSDSPAENKPEKHKPEWKEAPKWANYLCQDEDGAWYWFESKPYLHEMFDCWHSSEKQAQRANEHKGHNRDWKTTLEKIT